MDSSFFDHHFIHNFPKGYAWHKKIVANIMYFLTGIVIHPRKNLLTHTDLIKARLLIRRGDIALWGNLRDVSALIVGGPLTHASIYVGHKRFIEAVVEGVRYTSFHHLFTEYDTCVILRLPGKVRSRQKKIDDAIAYAEEHIGRPYDFGFTRGAGKLFCTELVNYAYQKAKHNTGLKNLGKFGREGAEMVQKYITAARALHPNKFVEKGNFDIVFMSHNLELRNRLVLKK